MKTVLNFKVLWTIKLKSGNLTWGTPLPSEGSMSDPFGVKALHFDRLKRPYLAPCLRVSIHLVILTLRFLSNSRCCFKANVLFKMTFFKYFFRSSLRSQFSSSCSKGSSRSKGSTSLRISSSTGELDL